MIELLKYSGIAGVLALLIGLSVLIWSVVVITRGKRREQFVNVLILALIPVLLGLGGTWLGYRAIDQVVAAAPTPPTPTQLAEGRAQAWASTKVGLLASGPAFFFGVVGLAVFWEPKRRAVSQA